MTDNKLKLGVMGMSEGNGHPYSWGAIFNGYDEVYMKDCPFPVIPDYLSKQEFPRDTIPNAQVTHIWTQSLNISAQIAKAALIDNIVANPVDMIGEVDAVLLARDDHENHYAMSLPFLEAGIPVYIDKPLAVNVDEAKKILSSEKYEGQVYSCSALRYAREFAPNQINIEQLGKVRYVDATIPKNWDKYSVHIIEPVLGLIPDRGRLLSVTNTGKGEVNIVTVRWENNVHAVFKVLGSVFCPFSIRLFGEKESRELVFEDTFYAFKQALIAFVDSVRQKRIIIPRSETLEIIEIIERGFEQQ